MDFKSFWHWFLTGEKKQVVKQPIKPKPLVVEKKVEITPKKKSSFWHWFLGKKEEPATAKPVIQKKIEPVQAKLQKPTSKKPIPTRPSKTKKLTYGVILFILINSILGSSLFYLPSLGVISSGAASILVWVMLFMIAGFIMLYIGELITLHPTSEGTYGFCKRAYGRFGSFIAGWMIWIAGNFGMALNIVAAAQYFIPWQTTASFWMRIGFAVLWIVVLNFMAFRGIDAGSTMLVAFGIIATIVVSMMIIPSFIDIPALLGGTFQSPFHMMVPFFQHQGISIIAYLGLSLLLISEAFLGFEVISYMANEVAEPKKLHKTLFAGLGISGVIMILYILSSLGTVNFSDYVQNFRPFAVQAFNTLGSAGQDIIVFGMYLVIIGGAAAWPITGSRLIKAMSADKLFLKHFAVLHPKHGSPYRAVYFQSIAVAIFAWFIFRGNIVGWQDSYRTIYMIYVILSLIVLSLIIMTVPILRKKEAHLERPFKAPLAKTGPVLIVILFLVLIINWIFIEGALATRIIKMALSFVLLGLPFYFFVEMLYSGKSIRKINEHLAYFALISDKLFFPLTIRNKILKNIGNAKGKKILEYGCAVGTLTQKLADKVGPTGRIYATDLSYKKVKMTYKKNKYLSHVRVHHHPHLHDFKLKLPKLVDGVISIGMLSYMQHPQRILKSLSKHVKKGGEIIFVDFDKFFYLIPNVTWIKNDKMLKAMFRKAGFIVDIERHRSLLWQHIIITGVKR